MLFRNVFQEHYHFFCNQLWYRSYYVLYNRKKLQRNCFYLNRKEDHLIGSTDSLYLCRKCCCFFLLKPFCCDWGLIPGWLRRQVALKHAFNFTAQQPMKPTPTNALLLYTITYLQCHAFQTNNFYNTSSIKCPFQLCKLIFSYTFPTLESPVITKQDNLAKESANSISS